MSKNEKKLIDKIIKNETFEKGIDYNEEDFLDIKNGLENLANRMSRKTPQQFISYENKNPYFKKNLMQYFKNNSYYIDNNSFVSFINKKEELDVFLEIAHKNNNVHMELKMMLKNQKIRLTDIISIIDSKNISAEIIKNLTKELIEREDLTEDTLNYFKNRSQLQKIREIYVGFEYFLSENKNLSVQRYKLLNNEFDFKNTLRSDIFINNNNGHINQYYEIYNYKESELLKNKELFKFILNDYNDIINHTKLLNQLLSTKNKPTKEDIIILLKHYNNDFTQFDDEISVKLYNTSCHYIKSIDEFINLNKYINQSDMDVEKIKQYYKADSSYLTDNMNIMQYINSHQTLDVIKLYLEIDSSFLNSFVYEKDSTDNDIDKKIDRLKNILKNSNHNDFDDVYKECIENNDSMSVDIFNKILPREENLEYKDRSKKRRF